MSGQTRGGRAGLCSALWLPLFDDLADPVVVARLAGEAEEAGLARGARLGPRAVGRAGPAGGRRVDHAGSDRRRH